MEVSRRGRGARGEEFTHGVPHLGFLCALVPAVDSALLVWSEVVGPVVGDDLGRGLGAVPEGPG